MRVENRYGFDKVIHHETLDYHGPSVGWGIVPDQYSLAFAERHVLGQRTRPVFFDFHMVTSHAPWTPPRATDVKTPKALPSFGPAQEIVKAKRPSTLALRRIKQFKREPNGRHTNVDLSLTASLRRDYQATIHYDLELITEYLCRRERDGLVILLGDHQPPVITDTDASFDTPVHVLSRDPRRLEELRSLGFVSGMTIPRAAPPALAHAGLFSALVRTLAATSYPREQLPSVLPEGISLLP
jgi:hypothetical protein